MMQILYIQPAKYDRTRIVIALVDQDERKHYCVLSYKDAMNWGEIMLSQGQDGADSAFDKGDDIMGDKTDEG